MWRSHASLGEALLHFYCASARFISKQKSTALAVLFCLEAPPGFEPGNKGFADLCLTTWLCRLISQPLLIFCRPNTKTTFILSAILANCILVKFTGTTNCVPVLWSGLRGSNPPPRPWQGRALPNELNPHIWCLRSESNQRHEDFQSSALPTELQRQTAEAVKNLGDPDGTRTHDL